MEIRWGLSELPGLLAELGIERPFLVASDRWSSDRLPVEVAGIWSEVPSDRIEDAVEAASWATACSPSAGVARST